MSLCAACGLSFSRRHTCSSAQSSAIQAQHENDDHSNCSPRGCEEANQR